MNSILIKLLIYTVFAQVLPQHFSGITELIFKSIGLIALCDLFYYDVFYKITEHFERKVTTYFTSVLVFIFAIFLAVIVTILIRLHGFDSILVNVAILSLATMIYAVEVYPHLRIKSVKDLQKNAKNALIQYYRKGN